MRLVLEDFLARQKELDEELRELSELRKIQSFLKSELEKETKERKKAELKAARFAEKLKFANKNRFGSKKQNVRKDDKEDKDDETPDRNQEKEDYDGTDDSLSTKTVSSRSTTLTAVTTHSGKEGTKATPEFLQAIAYEVYVKNVTFGLLHQWLTDMGMIVSANTLRNCLKKGKIYNGCRDFISLTPTNIGLAYCQ